MKFADPLFSLSRPHFGQLATWVLLVFAVVLAFIRVEYLEGERIGPATILSFLPGSLLSSTTLYHVIRVVLVISALLWMARWWIPISCWTTVISFTALWALRMENTYHAAHIFNVTNMLLIVHAAWFHFYRHPIRASLAENRYWKTPLYPRWVFLLCIFHMGFFHSLAGISKIAYSGLDWGDGLSLQLWVHLWGWPSSPFRWMMVNSRTIATIFQTAALVFETVSILAIFDRRLRLLVGLGLLGFYVGVLGTFVDYGFHFNAILVALFFLPLEPLLRRRYGMQPADAELPHSP